MSHEPTSTPAPIAESSCARVTRGRSARIGAVVLAGVAATFAAWAGGWLPRAVTRAVAIGELEAAGSLSVNPGSRGLEVFFIDVEGGAATLIVSPAGESILIDSGNPGDRDGARIVHVLREHAKLTRLDHYVTTHWHRDHVGGTVELSTAVPVGRFYGHRLPDPLPADIDAALVEAWRALAGEPAWLSAGDRLPLKTAGLAVDVVAADGLVRGEAAGSPQARRCELGHEAKPEDTSDNARSLALHLAFGAFDLFAGGDITWNVEHKLACPRPIVPAVDVFVVDHHGLDASNNPVLIDALRPTVAVVNSGPRKGAEPRTMRALLERDGGAGVFQLHRNVREGAVNTDPSRIANPEEACDAAFVRLTVPADARRYDVAIPARGRVSSFGVR